MGKERFHNEHRVNRRASPRKDFAGSHENTGQTAERVPRENNSGMNMRETKSTNPERITLIRFLKKQGREKQAPIWLDIADNLAKPKPHRAEENLSGINRHTQGREIITIQG